MKLTPVGMLFLLVGLQSSGQQSTETEMRPDEIIVRLVDGTNGKRVEYEVASIWLGDAKSASNLLADKGEVAVEVDSAQPRDIRVTPNFFVDCRFKGDSREGCSTRYSVDEIVSKGIVTAKLLRPDSCSAKPGRSCSLRSLEIGGGTIEIAPTPVDSDNRCTVIYLSRRTQPSPVVSSSAAGFLGHHGGHCGGRWNWA